MKEKDPRIEKDPDFIISSKDNNSLAALIKRYPDGVPDKIICRALQISPEELQRYYNCAIVRLSYFLR